MRDCGGHDFELFRISRGEWALLLRTRLHILGCPACRGRVAELRKVSGLLTEALSTSASRQPFRRLSVPVATSIIVGGVFAFGSLAHQSGLVRLPEAAPAASHSSSPAPCDKVTEPKATNSTPVGGKCIPSAVKDPMSEKRRRAHIKGDSIPR